MEQIIECWEREGAVREVEVKYQVRDEADRWWHQALGSYDDAIRVESDAHNDAVERLKAAYRLLPDFLANSALSATIVKKTPGLLTTSGKYHIGPPTAPDLKYDNHFPYDPNASASVADYASWSKWGAMLSGAQVARPGLDNATALYAHYRDGRGTDMWVDFEEGYREDPKIREMVGKEIAAAQQEAERLYRETGQTAFQMTGNRSYSRWPVLVICESARQCRLVASRTVVDAGATGWSCRAGRVLSPGGVPAVLDGPAIPCALG